MTQSTRPAPPNLRIPEINGLRGLAIIAVVWHHITIALAFHPPLVLGVSTGLLLLNGWTGVNLFFMLSGFVLYLPYAAQKRQIRNTTDAWTFYKHRFFRLIPLYYLVCVTAVVLSGHLAHADRGMLREAFAIATFTFPFHHATFVPASNWALWSIGTEVLFSVLFPLLAVLAARRGIKPMLIVALVLSLGVRAIRALDPPPAGPDWIADALLLGRLDEFVIGMALAAAWVRGTFWRIPTTRSGVLAVLLLLAACYGFDRCISRTISFEWMAILNNVFDLGLTLLILTLLNGAPWLRFLRWRVLQLPGMACYSIYLWHLPVMNALGLFKGNTQPAFMAAALLITLFLAALTYRFVEFRAAPDWRALFLFKSPQPVLTVTHEPQPEHEPKLQTPTVTL
ncbi:peptidoglycan/LPS O-acetylase OafA/YrhL [Silvimonas terrae]|uniref:Peptidoglycan/LPS O-acetylase OafA/YrhL n=1 Tax=Silvimonas terrae TaxID=300266 RepID=A0A840RN19_9NEIS|nr:acyltransferase [Silvimonas terrae]MBB5193666.1 peptidoglycan/LPS O-acetylase OafA/YrhL [Silvimonas terrae]